MHRSFHYRVDIAAWLRAEFDQVESLFWAVGARRSSIIALLAFVLGLASTDIAALGALAHQLKLSLSINNAAFGLIVTIATAVGAITTLPVGVWVDRFARIPLLIGLTVLWSIGMAWSGLAGDYYGLLFAQMLVGAVGIAIGPLIASLTGDLFPPSRRARVFGFIVGGELLGAGLGMIMASLVSEWLSWRAAFWVLGFMGFSLAGLTWRYLHEPRRGGAVVLLAQAIEKGQGGSPQGDGAVQTGRLARHWLIDGIRQQGIVPRQEQILHHDPTRLPWWRAVLYILSIRTNLILMIASAAGYFYFNGLLAFAVLYLMERFHLSPAAASALFLMTGGGSLIGVLLSGYLSDRLLKRGVIAARVWVTAGAFMVAVACFAPAFLSASLPVSAIFFAFAALSLGATNPSLDAARLDIMHSRLWGRAESVRTALRYALVSLAPYAFGLVSVTLSPAPSAGGGAFGLELTFLLMLAWLVMAAVIMIFAGFSYPRDVATAMASEHETTEKALASGGLRMESF